MLDVTCPSCQKLLQVAETAVDRDSQCPVCATTFRPESVWRCDSPFVTNAPALGIAEKPEWSPEPDEILTERDPFLHLERAQSRRARMREAPPADPDRGRSHIIRVGIIGFLLGCLCGVAFLIRMATAFPGSDQDLWFVPLMGMWTGIGTASYAFLLACITDTIQRRIARIGACATIGIALAGYAYHFAWPPETDPMMGVIVVTAIIPFLVIGCYIFIAIAWKSLLAILELRNGFFKAAGHPTRPTTRDKLRHFLDDNQDEDQL